jgi:hypothetical protein
MGSEFIFFKDVGFICQWFFKQRTNFEVLWGGVDFSNFDRFPRIDPLHVDFMICGTIVIISLNDMQVAEQYLQVL